MNIEEFIIELNKIEIYPSPEQLQQLATYKDMLIESNQKFNLTAIKDPEEIYLKHFYDSLTLSKALDLTQNLKLLDIGTGAGFPGLVLKIFFPNLEVVLLDSNNKKITFLNNVIEQLNLSNVRCIHNRAEEVTATYREYFDIITSRAVSHTRILAEISLPMLKIGGLLLPMKGNITDELTESKQTLAILNAKILEKIEFKLPCENSQRTIIKIEKTAPTPSKYPRKYDQIVKYPLK